MWLSGKSFHASLFNGHLDTVRLLLDHGADLNLEDHTRKTSLVRAYDYGNIEAMQLLLEYCADVDVYHSFGSVLHHASCYERAEVVRPLLRHNCNVNARGRANWTPLHLTSINGHPEVVELLLNHGADVDAQSQGLHIPLLQGSRHGRPEVVRILLAYGANVKIQGEGNQTAFQIATSSGRIEVRTTAIGAWRGKRIGGLMSMKSGKVGET